MERTIGGFIMTSPVEWHKQQVMERRSQKLMEQIRNQHPASIMRALDEIRYYISHTRPLMEKNPGLYDRTMVTFDKFFFVDED